MELQSFLEFISGILVIDPRDKQKDGKWLIATREIQGERNPTVEALTYVKFLESSGIRRLILANIKIERPLMLQEVWPEQMDLVPISENGKLFWMMRGDDITYITCKFYRLRMSEIPKVDFVPYNRVVNCIIRSDIAWPLTPYDRRVIVSKKDTDPGGMLYRLMEAGYHPKGSIQFRYRDTAGKTWLFYSGPRNTARNTAPIPGRGRGGYTHHSGYFTRKGLPLPARSPDYPLEYRLPELDPSFVSLDELSEILRKYGGENLENLEVIVSLLAMKIKIDRNPVEIFGDNLHIFGYCRTPLLCFYHPDRWPSISDISKNPSILYRYQAERDKVEQIGYIDRDEDIVAMPMTSRDIEIPIRSWELTRRQTAAQIAPKVREKVAKFERERQNVKYTELKDQQALMESILEENVIDTNLSPRILEEIFIETQSREKANKTLYSDRWDEGVEWPSYVEDLRQVKINGVIFNLGELRYVFHNTYLGVMAEGIEEGEEINTEAFNTGEMKIVRSFLDGKLAPEEFYRAIDDQIFSQLSSRNSYLDYYEKLDNRRQINLDWIMLQPFVELLQRIQKKFFVGIVKSEEL